MILRESKVGEYFLEITDTPGRADSLTSELPFNGAREHGGAVLSPVATGHEPTPARGGEETDTGRRGGAEAGARPDAVTAQRA